MRVADWTGHKLRKRFRTIGFFLALSLAAFIWLVPIIWMFSLSLTPNEILKTVTTSLIPIKPTLKNYISVFQVGLTPRWFLNSAIVTVTTTVGTLVLCAMAGYAFARLEFKGKNVMFPFVLAGLMVPKEAMFIPLFLMFAEFEMHNTYPALILPRVAAPLGVFIMTQFLKAIPPRYRGGCGTRRCEPVDHLLENHAPHVRPSAHGTGDLHLHSDLERLPLATGLRHREGDVHDHHWPGISPG